MQCAVLYIQSWGVCLYIPTVFIGSAHELLCMCLLSPQAIELLPYHVLGRAKWQALAKEYPLDGAKLPTHEEVQAVIDKMQAAGVPVICNN